MVWDAISEKLIQQGYVQSSRDRRIAEFLIQVTEDKKMNICSIIKNVSGTHLPASQIADSAKQLERKFLLSGYSDVNVMNIIFTEYDEDVRTLEDENVNFWIVDMQELRLKIFENQQDDYCGTRNVIERALINYGNDINSNDRKREISRPANVSFVTGALVIINILVFIICEIKGNTEDGGFMVGMGALNHRLVSEYHEYYRLITSMFLHFGVTHITNNMLSLALVGSQIEKWLGHLRYGLIYLISGLGGGVASLAYHRMVGENVVSAGASGAIYGLFGAMLVMMLKNKGNKNAGRSARLTFLLLIFGSFQNNVDFAAHIGGLVVGLIITFAMMPGEPRNNQCRT